MGQARAPMPEGAIRAVSVLALALTLTVRVSMVAGFAFFPPA